MLGYLEEIQRKHGLFVAEQRSFTLPGTEGAKTIAAIMDALPREAAGPRSASSRSRR